MTWAVWSRATINPVSEADWFRVELVAGKRYQIDLEGAPTDRGTLTDPHLFNLYNAAATEISGTGNGGGGVGVNARVDFTPNADGTYFVRAAAWLLATGTYTLSVIELGANGASEADSDFPITTSTSGEVDVGGSVTGTVDRSFDTDWFGVELVEGKRYQIDLEGADTGRGTLTDPHLYSMADAGGNNISDTGNADDGVGNNARIIFTPTTNGTHFVRTAAWLQDTGTYTLSVRDVTPPPHLEGEVEVDGPVARGTISEPVHKVINNNMGQPIGNNHFFDYDWLAVELQEGRTYQIDLEPVIHNRDDGTYYISLLPEIVAIYDADSNFLHHTSDRESSGPGYAARVEFTPNASGTYYISASGLGFTSGEYELTVIDITQDDD